MYLCVSFSLSSSLPFRLLDKRSFLRAPNPPFPPFGEFLRRGSTSSCPGLIFNPETDVVLGASGNVEIGVEVFDDPAAGADSRWEWDDGHWAMDQWLKLQSSYPDDLELEHALPARYASAETSEEEEEQDSPCCCVLGGRVSLSLSLRCVLHEEVPLRARKCIYTCRERERDEGT